MMIMHMHQHNLILLACSVVTCRSCAVQHVQEIVLIMLGVRSVCDVLGLRLAVAA
jgi:hypothetical protein